MDNSWNNPWKLTAIAMALMIPANRQHTGAREAAGGASRDSTPGLRSPASSGNREM